jgi:hypothetical protein
MLLQLRHKSLNVYGAVRELTKEVYALTILLPTEEKRPPVSRLSSYISRFCVLLHAFAGKITNGCTEECTNGE